MSLIGAFPKLRSVTNRRRLCMKVLRGTMDWPIIGKCRNQFWFVVLASFLFWFVYYLYYSEIMVGKVVTSFFDDEFANYVKSDSIIGFPGNSNSNSNGILKKLPEGSEKVMDVVEHVKDMNVGDHNNSNSKGNIKKLPEGKESEGDVVNHMNVGDHNSTENHTGPTKNWYNPFKKYSSGDYGVENYDDIVDPNNQTHLEVKKDNEKVTNQVKEPNSKKEQDFDSCSGRYIYVYRIPRKFNDDLLRRCRSLSDWTDMCLFSSNMGLGPHLTNTEKVYSKTGWYATNQFMLEVIFHNRMKQYECLTNDSSLASAIFVPYYAGLDVSRYLWYGNLSMRDAGCVDLAKWLRQRPEWKKWGGRDHFSVAGRITWDFRRGGKKDSDWGNKLMLLPESKNMTVLVIESSPWNNNDFAIPYPTYFHPSSDKEVYQWQTRMRRQRRRFFFSFAGARRPNLANSIRNEIIDQCLASRGKCTLLECTEHDNKCYKPVYVMRMFQNSVFCLQPPGDSFTRRSAFDSILAGCIPVFFHPGSAYVQYIWHLPKDYTKYSVLIPAHSVKKGEVSIEKILLRIPRSKVKAMRDEVIKLIPRLIYADPRSRLENFQDAFDITIKGVLKRVKKIRREMREGRNSSFDFIEEDSWKHDLFGTVGEHEWDHFFLRAWNVNNF